MILGLVRWKINIAYNEMKNVFFLKSIITVLYIFIGHINLFGQAFSVQKISENANIRTDRRPIHIGYYDSEANKTFVSWMGSRSVPIVKAYDHSTNSWSADKIVDEAPFVDKHNYPGMVKGSDGRIFLFHGAHNSTLKMAISPKPGTVEGEWESRFIKEAERASYPAPVTSTGGKMYVFYRDTRKTNGYSDDRPYQVVKSVDNGATWTRQMVIDQFPRSADNMTEIYNGKVTYEPAHDDQGEKIHIAWTIAGEKNGQHAHATYGRNVYYAYLNPENDRIYSVEGKDLGPTVDNSEAEQYCKAWDSGMPDHGHYAGLQVSVHYRDNGYPLIYFYNQREGGSNSITWNDSKWIRSEIGPEGGDPRGFEKLGAESFRVYRPEDEKVNLYKTTDGGLNWELETAIEVGQEISRVNVIDNYHPDAKLLLTEDGDGELMNANRDVFIGKVVGSR